MCAFVLAQWQSIWKKSKISGYEQSRIKR